VETSPKSLIAAKSPLRNERFLPDIFTPDSLKTQFVKRLQRFYEQRMLRMLKRLGIRAKDQRRAYAAAGGPAREVRKKLKSIQPNSTKLNSEI